MKVRTLIRVIDYFLEEGKGNLLLSSLKLIPIEEIPDVLLFLYYFKENRFRFAPSL